MRKLIYFEWLHFGRNVSRPIAVLLFLLAASFGLYNGFTAYEDRLEEIEAINSRSFETIEQATGWLDKGKAGPEERPWVDINTPFWSMWYATHYLVQEPKSTMIYNLGQSEHFGYYKRVSMWTTAFDADLTAEIANPELVQLGSLDFTFVWLYLMPLLLIVLTYHTKGQELDLGFVPLIKIQEPSFNKWLLQRILIIGFGMLLILTTLLFIPLLINTNLILVVEVASLWLTYAVYLILWLMLVYLVILFGKGQADQALKMVGVWLLLTVAIPGLVNQYVLLNKPADLMMDMIEAGREGQAEIFDRPQKEIVAQALAILPALNQVDAVKYDSLQEQPMINGAYRLVLNQYMNDITDGIINDQLDRNKFVASTYWFNPITGFHNRLNNLTTTGHASNLEFRRDIQEGGTIINRQLVLDEWNKREMDMVAFDEYVNLLKESR